MGLPVGWSRASGDLQGGSNSVSQVDGVSDLAPDAGSVGVAFCKGIMPSAHLGARYFSFSLRTTDALQAATPVLDLRGSKSE